jgi:hypothetical protein
MTALCSAATRVGPPVPSASGGRASRAPAVFAFVPAGFFAAVASGSIAGGSSCCANAWRRDEGTSKSDTDSGMFVTAREASNQPVGKPRRYVNRFASTSSIRFCPYKRLAMLEPLISITAPSCTFDPLRDVSTCRLMRRMFSKAAASFSGNVCCDSDFEGPSAFTSVDCGGIALAGFAAIVLLFATALGDPPFVFFGISGSLGKRSVRVEW